MGELDAARRQAGESESRSGRLEADLEQVRSDLDAAKGALRQEAEARAETKKVLAELRIEAATLTERAAHVEKLRTLVRSLQEQQDRAEGAGKPKAAPKRSSKPERTMSVMLFW